MFRIGGRRWSCDCVQIHFNIQGAHAQLFNFTCVSEVNATMVFPFTMNHMKLRVTVMTLFATTKEVHQVNHVVLFGILGEVERLTSFKGSTNSITILEVDDETVSPNEIHANQNWHQHRRIEPIFLCLGRIWQCECFKRSSGEA